MAASDSNKAKGQSIMNIFGIGGAELVLILIIMLSVAGPKRMIRWAYVLGTYIGKLQRMWSEVVAVLQREMDEAGVDVKLPKQLPTRQNLNQMVQDTFKSASDPLQSAQQGVKDDITSLRNEARIDLNEPNAVAASYRRGVPPPEPVAEANGTGNPSAQGAAPSAQAPDLGAWSNVGREDEARPNKPTNTGASAADDVDWGTWSGRGDTDFESD